ncbi:MAG: hypothetical protein DYH13_05180 [Alphaproteobacteria bacterium PRO2]|nr:hypothetical protein [Alphaproteobacteria bacterium PRO2]
MFRKYIKTLLFLGVLFSSSAIAAEQSPVLEKLGQTTKCSEKWDVLWPLAKEGDLEARAYLTIYMFGIMHHPDLCAPGGCDYASKLRNILIMAVHAGDYEFPKTEEYEFLREYFKTAFDYVFEIYQLGYENGRGDKFMKCLHQSKGSCAKIAVDEGIVPSFERYAVEIDALSGAGFKRKCVGVYKTLDGFVEAD